MAGRPAALVSDESALEACIRDSSLYKLMIFTFTFYLFKLSYFLTCLLMLMCYSTSPILQDHGLGAVKKDCCWLGPV